MAVQQQRAATLQAHLLAEEARLSELAASLQVRFLPATLRTLDALSSITRSLLHVTERA